MYNVGADGNDFHNEFQSIFMSKLLTTSRTIVFFRKNFTWSARLFSLKELRLCVTRANGQSPHNVSLLCICLPCLHDPYMTLFSKMSLTQKATLLLRFLKVIRSIDSLGRFVQLLRCATHISVNMSQKMSCQHEP
jgi:hypothetical protein